MKKITFLFAFIGMIMLQSCTVNDVQPTAYDNDTISEVYEVTRSFTTSNNFSALVTFPHTIYSSDMVLVYRLAGADSYGDDIWKILPETHFFNDGTLDFRYDFDFTKYDASIFLDGYDLASLSPAYRTNQIMRIVIVPGYFIGKKALDTSDYNAVIKSLGNSKVVKLN